MPDDNPALLRFDDLAAGYGGRALLTGLNAEVNAGESLAIRGTSGSGKSTLLRTLAGLIDPVAGTVWYRGEAIARYGMQRYRSEAIYVAQQPALLDGDVRTNLARPFEYRCRNDREFSEADASALLDRFGLDAEVLTQDAGELSVGQRQRVCLVRALLLSPSILFLDEPTSALDEANRDAVETVLHEGTQRNGLAILVATHDAAQADRLGQRTLNLDDYVPERGAA